MAGTLNAEQVLLAAERIVDEGGWDALTIAAVAQAVGVKGPSLYTHVSSLDDVRAGVQARAMTALSGMLQEAAMGRVGADALRAMCEAFRSFALQHPNRYLAMTRPAIDRSLMAAASIGADAAVRAALRAFELTEDEVFDAEVALYATAHGFVSLEVGGVFGGSVDATQADHLYAEAIERFVSGVEHRSLDARA